MHIKKGWSPTHEPLPRPCRRRTQRGLYEVNPRSTRCSRDLGVPRIYLHTKVCSVSSRQVSNELGIEFLHHGWGQKHGCGNHNTLLLILIFAHRNAHHLHRLHSGHLPRTDVLPYREHRVLASPSSNELRGTRLHITRTRV